MNDWGAGFFLAVKFGGFSDGLTYEDVQVGLDPSEGAGMVTLDSDCNGVFKITDKDTQVLKVVQSDGAHTLTQTFDLSGLTLATPAVNTISPTSATYDLNESGANHGDKVFTVTPATAGKTIAALLDDENDEIPDNQSGTPLWTLDTTELVITLKTAMLDVFGAAATGESVVFTIKLSDNSTATLSIAIEDTT